MLGNNRLKNLGASGFEHSQSVCLIALHEAAVADYVSGKDGGETTFHLLPLSSLQQKAKGVLRAKPTKLPD
jgi:hypothetical protein